MGVAVPVAAAVGVGVAVFDAIVGVAVPVGVAVAVDLAVAVDVASAVAVGIVVAVGVGVSTSEPKTLTVPSSLLPEMLPPLVSLKLAGGRVEKPTGARRVSLGAGVQMTIKSSSSSIWEGSAPNGGEKSAIRMSSSPSLSSASKLTDVRKDAGI